MTDDTKVDWDELGPKLDKLERVLAQFGSPRDVIPLLTLIMGRYTAAGLPDATLEEAFALVMPPFLVLFKQGFHFGKLPGEKAPTTSPRARWFKCKGCGEPLVLFDDGSGRVGHAKPSSLVGVPHSVACSLYNRLSSEELRALHEDAEPIESPGQFEEVLG